MSEPIPFETNEADLVVSLLLLRAARFKAVKPAPDSHSRLVRFELELFSPLAADVATSWNPPRFAGTHPGLKTSPSLPVSLVCRVSPGVRTLLQWVRTGEIISASHLVPEVVEALKTCENKLPTPPDHAL